MTAAQRRTWLTPALLLALMLWFACEAVMLHLGKAIHFGRLAPVGDFDVHLADVPMVWALPAAIGAVLGVLAALIAVAFNQLVISFRSALALVAIGSLVSALPHPFSDHAHAAFYAAVGVEANARSLCFAAFGACVVCVLAAIDAARATKAVALQLCFATAGALSLGFGVHALQVHGTLYRRWPLLIDVQMAPIFGLGIVCVVVAAGLTLAVAARAFQCTALVLLLLGVGSWGRESLVPIPTSQLSVGWIGEMPTSPWRSSLVPLLPLAMRVVFTDTDVYYDGIIRCEISRCTTELREKFVELRQQLEAIGQAPEATPVYVFPSTNTSLTDLQHVIADARAQHLTVEIGFVRRLAQLRPILGPLVSFEAGYIPGLADELLTRVEPVLESSGDRQE